jgi:hypothetical protein
VFLNQEAVRGNQANDETVAKAMMRHSSTQKKRELWGENGRYSPHFPHIFPPFPSPKTSLFPSIFSVHMAEVSTLKIEL